MSVQRPSVVRSTGKRTPPAQLRANATQDAELPHVKPERDAGSAVRGSTAEPPRSEVLRATRQVTALRPRLARTIDLVAPATLPLA
jgi:hypothetical protein